MQDFPTIDEIVAAIGDGDRFESHLYASAFQKRSTSQQDGWSTLARIFELHERLEDVGEPFGPMMTTADGRRTFIPADLSEDDLNWLHSLEREVENAEFCARVSDMLWLCKRDAGIATRAVRYYLDAGLALEDLEHWTESVARYTRAYRLATQLGRKGQLRSDVLDFILERLRTVKGQDPRWWSMKLMTLLYEANHGDQAELIEYASITMQLAGNGGDFRRQRDYLELIAKLQHRSGDGEACEATRVIIARSLHREAEAAEAEGGAMKAHHSWELTMKAFRERPSLRAELPDVQLRLASAGRETIKQMQSQTTSTDISEIVEDIQSRFCGQTADVVICRFVLFPLSNRTQMQKEEIERKVGVFSSMFEKRFFDYEGRTIGIAPGALTSSDPDYEERIESDVQRSMQIRRNFSVQASILVALRAITSEHSVDAEFLSARLANSAFVPDERLDHFIEGLVFGFNWQFSLASHLLIPQFEAGLRNIATRQGTIPRNLLASGVEDVWTLDRLLSEEVITSQLGEDLTFELRSLLIANYGPKFRHNLAHGLIPPNALAGVDAVYAWWLFLRLCLFPTAGFQEFLQQRD